MNEYFKGIRLGGGAQNGSSVLSTSRSVILPQAQVWYLIKAKLHHSAGKGSWVQEKAYVYTRTHVCMCVWKRKCLRERAQSRETEVQGVGKEAKENVWASAAKTGACAVWGCRLSDVCVDQCRAGIKQLAGTLKSPLHLVTTYYSIFFFFFTFWFFKSWGNVVFLG